MIVKPKPLITLNSFINSPLIMGNEVSLYPLQKEILQEFWNNSYSTGVWCLGRRSGKTFLAALSAVYACTALAPIYKQYIRSGENYYVLFVANNEEQAKIALEQVKIFINSSPILKRGLKKPPTATSITLTNGAVFKVVPNTAKGIRGYPVALAILDEAAHYRTGSGEVTGKNLYDAIAPSVAQFGNYGRILFISTPWTKQGIFYDSYQKGVSGDYDTIHVANYPTWEVNPKISQEFLEDAKKRDPVMFEVEFGANFAVDFAAFLDVDFIENSVKLKGASTCKPEYKSKYFLALDPALSGDAFTAAIGHQEGQSLFIDLFHEFLPTFSQGKKKVVDISMVENWILEMHRVYGFKKVVLDQYQSAGTIQRLSKTFGSKIQELTWTHNSKIEAYSYLKELLYSNKLFLYPHEKAISQLKNLQVHYNNSGSWSVSGGSGLKVDDYCSVIAALSYITRDHKEVFWSKFKLG
jgi:phage terminase large subunit-like protein